MSPARAVPILQSKLSDDSRNRKAKIFREWTTTVCAQILFLPEGVLGICLNLTMEDKSRTSSTQFPLTAHLPGTVLKRSSWGRPISSPPQNY